LLSERQTTQHLPFQVGHGITLPVDAIPERNLKELSQPFTIAAQSWKIGMINQIEPPTMVVEDERPLQAVRCSQKRSDRRSKTTVEWHPGTT